MTTDDDPEFNEKTRHLETFVQLQEMLLARGGPLSFKNEREKLRYLCFILGAIDQLSRTVEDSERGELWQFVSSSAQAIMLFGAHDANTYVEQTYGNIDDPELYEAGRRGWAAMRAYISYAVGKITESEFQVSCAELFSVVKGVKQ